MLTLFYCSVIYLFSYFFLINEEMLNKIPTQLHASLAVKGLQLLNITTTSITAAQHPQLQDTGHLMEVSVCFPLLSHILFRK